MGWISTALEVRSGLSLVNRYLTHKLNTSPVTEEQGYRRVIN